MTGKNEEEQLTNILTNFTKTKRKLFISPAVSPPPPITFEPIRRFG
jgi:hypothetical protein